MEAVPPTFFYLFLWWFVFILSRVFLLQLTRSHSSPCSRSSQREPEGKTTHLKADPNDRDRDQSASREGPSSVSAAVLAVRLARNRSVRSARTLGKSVPTCLYSTCNATYKVCMMKNIVSDQNDTEGGRGERTSSDVPSTCSSSTSKPSPVLAKAPSNRPRVLLSTSGAKTKQSTFT